MVEDPSSLSLTIAYATFINDELKRYIPASHQSNSFFITVGALTTWAEMVVHQARKSSIHIIETTAEECSDTPEQARDLANLMYHSADYFGKALSDNPPNDCFSVFVATLAVLLRIEREPELHSHVAPSIATYVTSFTKAWVEAYPISPQ